MKRLSLSKWRWLALLIVLGAGIAPLLTAEEPATPTNRAVDGRFHFDVVESFDAKYEGDTPGHLGRQGGLGDTAPLVALYDPVFYGDKKIGTITRAAWSRVTGSLEIEFDPEPQTRISVGEEVWIQIDGKKQP